MEPFSLTVLVVVAGGALLGSMASGLAGFAYAATTLGLYAHVLAPQIISPLIVASSLTVQLMVMPMLWRRLDWRNAMPFVIGGVAGVPFGIALLSILSPDAFRVLVGALLITYACGVLLARRAPRFGIEHKGADAGIGFLGGVLGGFAGLSGVLPTIWCSLRRWSKDRQRSVFQLFNIAMHIATLSGYAVQGRLTADIGLLLLITLPALALGGWLGFRLYNRIDDQAFARVLLVLLGISGLALIVPFVSEVSGVAL